ncbi:hypothetical protein GCM10011400_23670 [Paraburkholderia caffeinilytica]|uniref:Uncharacterized protein n=1 Tax=Paraburkholderia caffeinilytica TaxID=1761016 RepID=A0ABQ1M7H8_9BURK|nr:hypothetical protein GCM10011400_23670 [Paraburkholderia caffeinilytica]CAB3791240.1 hypothetical protein LMG28690_03222 [Paraburkholderia caffeinilytica]
MLRACLGMRDGCFNRARRESGGYASDPLIVLGACQGKSDARAGLGSRCHTACHIADMDGAALD